MNKVLDLLRSKLMLVLVGLVFVIAAVLVVIGVSAHDEPGFIEDVPTWNTEDLPLTVTARRYTSEGLSDLGNTERVVRDSVDTVNRRLGCSVFLYREDWESALIQIEVGVPYEADWQDEGGDALLIHAGGRAQRCNVDTSNIGTNEMLWLVLYHEFGHCLGLAHDDYELSIMRPVQSPTPGGQLPPWFSDYDRRLLRDRYCR